MALTSFYGESVVAGYLTDSLLRSHVFGPLITEDNPTNMGPGSSYKIPSLGEIDVGDYVPGTDITLQNLSATNSTLAIDQQKSVSFYFDKVDDAKSAKKSLQSFIIKAKNKLADTQDAYVAAQMSTDAGVYDKTGLGLVGVPLDIDETNITDLFASIVEEMDANSAPQEGRFVVIPPFARGSLAKSNISTASSTLESARTLGWVSQYMGLNVYVSNNLKHSAISVITFDGDFETSSSISGGSINGNAIGTVAFSASHAVTSELYKDALEAVDTVVSVSVDSTGRIFTIKGDLTNTVLAPTVYGGASNPTGVVSINTTDKTYGQHVIASVKPAFLFVNTLSEVELWAQTEKRFAEMFKALNVYGAKSITPAHIVRAVISKA